MAVPVSRKGFHCMVLLHRTCEAILLPLCRNSAGAFSLSECHCTKMSLKVGCFSCVRLGQDVLFGKSSGPETKLFVVQVQWFDAL